MKRLYFSLLVFFVFAGCQEDAEPVPSIIGQWKLVSMDSGWGLPTILDKDATYGQTYKFNVDGTFVKTRIKDGKVSEGSGTYTLMEPERILPEFEDQSILLEFLTGNELVECCGTPDELLFLRNSNLLRNTWDMCDGPVLAYNKN